ncbi:hypothetical protein SAMN04489713_10734 [Actinomadura madurae]|uniref:Uncharacterized protein n=1 Tax=Actinomadura madurae TaxID=1993 RepID=A0A1I5I064_9ACTN|nr:hypothetical protein SAMN04489713_10734 [Actinomadura madurae]
MEAAALVLVGNIWGGPIVGLLLWRGAWGDGGDLDRLPEHSVSGQLVSSRFTCVWGVWSVGRGWLLGLL